MWLLVPLDFIQLHTTTFFRWSWSPRFHLEMLWVIDSNELIYFVSVKIFAEQDTPPGEIISICLGGQRLAADHVISRFFPIAWKRRQQVFVHGHSWWIGFADILDNYFNVSYYSIKWSYCPKRLPCAKTKSFRWKATPQTRDALDRTTEKHRLHFQMAYGLDDIDLAALKVGVQHEYTHRYYSSSQALETQNEFIIVRWALWDAAHTHSRSPFENESRPCLFANDRKLCLTICWLRTGNGISSAFEPQLELNFVLEVIV